jgi:hypothetical protein
MTGDLLNLEIFLPHVGSEFALSSEENGAELATLALARADRSKWAANSERAFSLVFRGPALPALTQGMYWLRHPVLGSLCLFLVPISGDSQQREYEAVFN